MNPAMMNKIRKMQKEMMEAQKRLEESIFTGTAGGGMVKVEVKGDKTVLSIDIDEDILNPEDKEMIQDTIVAAINDVMRKIDEETNDVMGAFTGGMGMPGLFENGLS